MYLIRFLPNFADLPEFRGSATARNIRSPVKGTQSVIGLHSPGHYFCQFDKHLPQPKIKCMRWIQSRNQLRYCLVFHLILDLILKTSFWANFYISYKVLSYLVQHSIKRNMNFAEQIIVIYIVYLENWWRKVTYIWKLILSRPWTFGNDSEFVSFLTSTDFSNSKVWLSLDKSISEFSMVYIKWVLWYVLGSIITISTCKHTLSSQTNY